MIKNLRKNYNLLCSPAQVYILISAIAIITMLIQNINEPRKYCIGRLSCHLNFNNLFLFIVKVLYVIFWAIVLDSLCKNGYKDLAWAIVLLPFFLLFLLVVLFIMAQM
jgi:ABC-type polysaccharide transport system permease subunit